MKAKTNGIYGLSFIDGIKQFIGVDYLTPGMICEIIDSLPRSTAEGWLYEGIEPPRWVRILVYYYLYNRYYLGIDEPVGTPILRKESNC